MSDRASSEAPAVPGGSGRPGRVRARSKHDPLRFFWRWVVVPAATVYLAVGVVVVLTLGVMTSEINRVELERNERSIAAALDTSVFQLREQVTDEAVWTDAYLNTYGSLNLAWLDSTWGTTARDDGHYDTVIVTDAKGDILFGESTNGPLTGNLGDHYAATTEMLAGLAEAVAGVGDAAVVGHYVRSSNGPVAMAGAVIHGQSSQMSIPPDARRILWLARRVDDAMLKRVAQRFHVPVPRFVTGAVDENAQTLALNDVAGNTVGVVNWQPLRPGDSAFVNAAGTAAFFLLVLGGVIFSLLAAFRTSILHRAESEERDWISARYDRATGLVNRLGLEELLDQDIPRGEELALGLACIEFDGLKDIAGSYGEETVERLLDRLADLIDTALDAQATIARIGPDRFALACTGAGAGQNVRRFAEITVELVAEAIPLDDLRLKLRATAGVAEASVSAGGVGKVLGMAGTALQRARDSGEYLVVHEPALEEALEYQLAMQADIRRGLDEGEFDLVYQPIFDFATQAMLGAEALLRWPRRAAGVLSPAEFIPVAESSGLIEELGLFALRRACEDLVNVPDLKVSVNISTVQLRSPTLSSRIESILNATNFPPERLQLEVTESFLLAQPERAKATIEELRRRGITLALDDFGTGFSSIGYLRQFSFDRVKLDRTLIDFIDNDPVKLALVESTMIYCFAMGLAVTAEGVERAEEAATLMRLGCREFQGYLLSRPLALPELGRLAERSTELRRAS